MSEREDKFLTQFRFKLFVSRSLGLAVLVLGCECTRFLNELYFFYNPNNFVYVNTCSKHTDLE